jgi:hypothetical protein
MMCNNFWKSLALFATAVSIGQAQTPTNGGDPPQVVVATDHGAAALKLFDEKSKSFPADLQPKIPMLRSLLARYFDGEVMTESEVEVAHITLDDIGYGSSTTVGTRGASLDDLMGGGAPAASHKPAGHAVNVTTVRSKPKFTSGVSELPGHGSLAWVKIEIEGRSRKVIEVPGSDRLSAGSRAKAIATRMAELSDKDRLWWMETGVGNFKNEVVVTAPGAPKGFVVTADKPYAKEVGKTPTQLARYIIAKIKSTMDNRGGSIYGTRALPDDSRNDAINLRQDGDDLFASKPADAEAKYRSAIQTDPTYAVAYVRLIELLLGEKKGDEAEKVRTDGLQAVDSDADKTSIQNAGKSK